MGVINNSDIISVLDFEFRVLQICLFGLVKRNM